MQLRIATSAVFLVVCVLAFPAAAQQRRMPTPVPGSVVEPHGADPALRTPRAEGWDAWGEAHLSGGSDEVWLGRLLLSLLW